MNVLSSHPFYINKEDVKQLEFEAFIKTLQNKSYFVHRYNTDFIRIAQHENSDYNQLFISYPSVPNYELAMCKFYNADGPFKLDYYHPTIFLEKLVIQKHKLFYAMCYGNDLTNSERVLKEPFCSEILDIFLSSIKVYRCPKCNGYTFGKEDWEKEDSIGERIEHGIYAIATVLFLGWHGAGWEWYQATKQRYKYKGFKVICKNCGLVHSVTTNIIPL